MYIQRCLLSIPPSDPVTLLHSDAHQGEVHRLILATLEQCQVHSKCSQMFTATVIGKLEIKQVKTKNNKKRKNKPEEPTNHERHQFMCGIFVSMKSVQMSQSPEKYKPREGGGVTCECWLPGSLLR